MAPSGRPGELAELGRQLNAAGAPRTKEALLAKKELFQKVIGCVTIGVDVSSLFPSMVMAASAPPPPALLKELAAEGAEGSFADFNVVIKKMLYLYICTYASSNQELALLTVNTLLKDAAEGDATIRGLALRSLCGLKVPNLMEYLLPAVAKGLEDKSAYVRRTAALGVLKACKLHEKAKNAAGGGGDVAVANDPVQLVESIKALLLRDTDPQVVSNCLSVLSQLEGYASLVTKPLVYGLINRMKDFNEWNQCQVLHFVSLYEPKSKEETFDIMNALEDRLSHSNSAVVLATAKVFLHLTLPLPDVHQQVFGRIKNPLLTLAGSQVSPECAFSVLSHLRLLVSRAPVLFATDYRSFFVRASDPTYVKELKLEVLALLAHVADTTLDGAASGTGGRHLMEIINELLEYVTDTVDVYLSRLAIRCIGTILLSDEGGTAEGGDAPSEDMGMLVERLMLLLSDDLGHSSGGADGVGATVGTHVTEECIVVLRDVLRKSPSLFSTHCKEVLASSMPDDLRLLPSAQARAAYAWILGEFADGIPNAPYVLEDFVVPEDEDAEAGDPAGVAPLASEPSASVRIEVMTALAKAFLLRPAEVEHALSAALTIGKAESDINVRGRADHLVGLLEDADGKGMDAIGRIMWGGRAPGERVGIRVCATDEPSPAALDRIFREFNSLSVVYRKPASTFVSAAVIEEDLGMAASSGVSGGAAAAGGGAGGGATAPGEADLLSMEDTNLLVLEEPENGGDGAAVPGSPGVSTAATGIDLLSF